MTPIALPDGCADVVISNGAINLAPDKAQVLAGGVPGAQTGGRLQVADMGRTHRSDAACCAGNESWRDCVSGTARSRGKFTELLVAAGSWREVVALPGLPNSGHTRGRCSWQQGG